MAKSPRRSAKRAARRPTARKAAARKPVRKLASKAVRKISRPRPAPPKPTTVSLELVAHRALEDKPFFRALDANVERALGRENWQLSPRDLVILKRSLHGKLGAPARVVLHPRRVFQLLHRLPAGLFDDLERAWGIGWGIPPSKLAARKPRTLKK